MAQTHKMVDKQKAQKLDLPTDRQTDKQTDRQTYRPQRQSDTYRPRKITIISLCLPLCILPVVC